MRNTLRLATTFGILAALPAVSGCAFDEEILIHDLKGTVRLPVEAGTRTFVRDNEDGTTFEETVVDARLIGPVYLGLYPSVLPPGTVSSYAHPELGPQYQNGVQGDTYPYGGTTIGDIKFACLEYLTCKTTTGRFATYDDMVDWFANVLEAPITDAGGKPIEAGFLIQQTCFDLLEVTSDAEIGLITGDRDGDGAADAADLDFVLSDDGQFWEAEFTIWQQNWYWDRAEEAETGCIPGEDCTGFSLWGFMDAPDTSTSVFSTCNPNQGYDEEIYDQEFSGGKAMSNVLNQPTQYITRGDWVANEGFVWKDMYEQPTLDIDFEVQ